MPKKKKSVFPADDRHQFRRSLEVPCSRELGSRLSHEAEGRMKRVRFSDSYTVHEVGFPQVSSPCPWEKNPVQSEDSSKTFEYKYYKKLLGDARQSSCPFPCDRSEKQLKKLETNINKPEKQLKKLKSSVCNQLAETPNKGKEKFHVRGLSPTEKLVTSTFSNEPLSPTKAPWNSGSFEFYHEHGQTFASMRKKLLQSAAEILSLEVDEIHLNRSNLLPEFLQRVDRIRSKRTSNASLKSGWPDCVEYPFASSKLDVLECSKIRKSNFPSSIPQHVKNGLPELWSDEADKSLQLWDGTFIHSLSTGNAFETCVWPRESKFHYVPASTILKNDTDPGLNAECLFNRRVALSDLPCNVSSFKELKKALDVHHECAPQREWYPIQLQGQDSFETGSDCSSPALFLGKRMFFETENMQPKDHQWEASFSNDRKIGCSPSIFHVRPYSKKLMPDFCPVSELRTCIQVKRDHPVGESDHLSWILSRTKNCLALREGYWPNASPRWNHAVPLLSPAFHMVENFHEERYPISDRLLENEIDLDIFGKYNLSNRSNLLPWKGVKEKSVSECANFVSEFNSCLDESFFAETKTHSSDSKIDLFTLTPFKLSPSMECLSLMLLDDSSQYGPSEGLSSE